MTHSRKQCDGLAKISNMLHQSTKRNPPHVNTCSNPGLQIPWPSLSPTAAQLNVLTRMFSCRTVFQSDRKGSGVPRLWHVFYSCKSWYLTSACACGDLWGGCCRDAGRSSRHPESSTPRSPAGAGKAASVATATKGRRPRRPLPQQPGPASRPTPGDEAGNSDHWQGSKAISQSVRPSSVHCIQRSSFAFASLVNNDLRAITREVSSEQWRRRWQRWASGALWWAALQKEQLGQHGAQTTSEVSLPLLVLQRLPAAVKTSGNRE